MAPGRRVRKGVAVDVRDRLPPAGPRFASRLCAAWGLGIDLDEALAHELLWERTSERLLEAGVPVCVPVVLSTRNVVAADAMLQLALLSRSSGAVMLRTRRPEFTHERLGRRLTFIDATVVEALR